ncbi:MAG: stage 0 sporulation family protein [Bacteroidia bacterium]
MGCGSCSSGGCSPAGCGDKGHCASGGCNRLNVHDWLSNLQLPWEQKAYEYVEVRFKENRKDFFRNINGLDLYQNDWVVVEAQQGHDVGQVTLKGELVRLQMKRRKVAEEDPAIRKIYRKATDQDRQKLAELREQEGEVAYRTREIIKSCKLNMKLTDVEFQGDRSKIIFYYTAEERVDFRELIRLLADAFKARVEMRQIGARQEAARIGGLGVCGRELCCSSWLTDFKSVSTSAARYQNLSLNPVKLAGQCGRLKCCLNYELETYIDALQAFPKDAKTLQTEHLTYELVKTDIFKRQMWYQLQGKAGEFSDVNAIPLSIEQAVEVRAMNKEGIKPASLEALAIPMELVDDLHTEPDFELESEGVLDRFDKSANRRNKKKKGKPASANRTDGRNQQPIPQLKREETPTKKESRPNDSNRSADRRSQQRPPQKTELGGDSPAVTNAEGGSSVENRPNRNNRNRNNRRRPPRGPKPSASTE